MNKKIIIGIIISLIIISSIGILFLYTDTEKDSSKNETEINGKIDEDEENMVRHDYKEVIDIVDGWYPINMHLSNEYLTYIYFVPFQNTLTIRKLNTSDGTSSLIVTEAVSITKFFLDRDNKRLYYYHAQSIFSYIDLTDDSITDLDDTLAACEDIFIYNGDLFAVDTSEDDLTYYKYTPGAPGTWGAVGTISEGKTNWYDIGALGGNDVPKGMCWDGIKFYITDTDDDSVWEYPADFSSVIQHDVGALGGNDNVWGVETDGEFFYVTDTIDEYVYKYNLDWTVATTPFNDVGALGCQFPQGICWDGEFFYIVSAIDKNVYKFSYDFSVLIDNYDISILGGNDSPRGICWDGEFFYVTDNDNHVYKYASDFSVIINDFNIGALGGNDDVYGITWDGNYFYITDPIDDYVYQYNSDLITELGSILYTVIILNNAYTIYQYITGQIKIYIKDLDTADNPVLLETVAVGIVLPNSESQRGVSVSSDNDTLYFVLKDINDGLTYLYIYIISTDILTKKGFYNIGLMLNRNTDPTNEPPFNLEKGFDITHLHIYQISEKLQLYKISDLTFIIDDGIIVAITDTYLIILRDSGDTELWKFQNVTDIGGIPVEKVKYIKSETTWATFQTETILGTGQTIELYDTVSNPGHNTLAFRGTVKTKNLKGKMRTYKCPSFDKEIFNVRFTKDYKDLGMNSKQIMEDLLDTYGIFMYHGTDDDGYDTIDPYGAFSTVREPFFQNKTFQEAFDELMDDEDGAWFWDPDGKIYAYQIANIPYGGIPLASSYLYEFFYGNPDNFNDEIVSIPKWFYGSPDNFNDETVGTTGTSIAWVESQSGNDSNIESIIVAEKNNHRNILKFSSDGDNGTNAYIYHYSAETIISDTYEWWWEYTDKGQGQHWFIIEDESANVIIKVYFNSLTNTIIWEYGDGVGGTSTGSQAAISETLYHIKLTFSATTDVWSLWIGGVLILNGEPFRADVTPTSIKKVYFRLREGGGANALEMHFDAWGEVADANYTEYDNTNTYGRPTDVAAWISSAVLTVGSSLAIVDEWQGHKNVLRLQDDVDAGQDPNISHDFTQSLTGIREFWIGTNDVTEEWYMQLLEGSSAKIQLRIIASQLQYFDSALSWQNAQAVSANIWYHIKIEWRNDDTFDLYIDEVKQVNNETMWSGMGSGLEYFKITLTGDSTDYFYIDGWGNIDDADYNEGDNKWHENVNRIDGIFKATYNFENDIVGNNPIGFTVNEAGGTVIIIEYLDGHKNIIELHDTDGANSVSAIQTFTTGQIIGTVEGYMRSSDATLLLRISIRGEAAQNSVQFLIDADKISVRDGGGWTDIVNPALDNIYYHWKAVFDCDTDTFDLYINSVLEITGAAFRNVATTLNSIIIETSSADNGYYGYLDALAYSWDPAYKIGENEEYEPEDLRIAIDETTGQIVNDVPDVNEIMEQINKVKLYGGIVNGARLSNVTPYGEDIPGQLIHGIIEYIDYFESKLDQDEINLLSDAILNRTGFADNPLYVDVFLDGLGFRNLIKFLYFAFGPYQEITDPQNFYPLELELDLKDPEATGRYLLSTGLVQENNELVAQNRKTSKSDEGQIDILATLKYDKIGFTAEGGIYCVLTNNTGAPSIKGTLVEADTADQSFDIASASAIDCEGAVYEDDIPDGEECKIVFAGLVEVLLKDGTAGTAHNWVGTSNVAGRADATAVSPPAAPNHFKEIGHCHLTVGAGTDVLCTIMMHFL